MTPLQCHKARCALSHLEMDAREGDVIPCADVLRDLKTLKDFINKAERKKADNAR